MAEGGKTGSGGRLGLAEGGRLDRLDVGRCGRSRSGKRMKRTKNGEAYGDRERVI